MSTWKIALLFAIRIIAFLVAVMALVAVEFLMWPNLRAANNWLHLAQAVGNVILIKAAFGEWRDFKAAKIKDAERKFMDAECKRFSPDELPF